MRYILTRRQLCHCSQNQQEDIDGIFFFEVNTKYISSSVLKTSEFSRVRSTSEIFDVFCSWDDIYLVFTEKSELSFYFILFRRFRLINYPCFKPNHNKLNEDKGVFATVYLDQPIVMGTYR